MLHKVGIEIGIGIGIDLDIEISRFRYRNFEIGTLVANGGV